MVSICFSILGILGTVLLYERLYFRRFLALVLLPRLPFSWGIKGEGDFFIEFPCLLTGGIAG